MQAQNGIIEIYRTCLNYDITTTKYPLVIIRRFTPKGDSNI